MLANRTRDLANDIDSERRWLSYRWAVLRQREERLNRTLANLERLEITFAAAPDVTQAIAPPAWPVASAFVPTGLASERRTQRWLRTGDNRQNGSSERRVALITGLRRSQPNSSSQPALLRLSAVELLDRARTASNEPMCRSSLGSPASLLPLIDVARNVSSELATRLGAQAMSGVALFATGAAAFAPGANHTSSASADGGLYLVELSANVAFCSSNADSLPAATRHATCVHGPRTYKPESTQRECSCVLREARSSAHSPNVGG